MLVLLLVGIFGLAHQATKPTDIDPVGDTLRAMEEPQLGNLKAEEQAFRFLWMRSFHPPILVQVERRSAAASLYVKMLDSPWFTRPEGTHVGRLVVQRRKAISSAQWYRLAELRRAGFWHQSGPDPQQGGVDGAMWLLEGYSWGEHRIVERWSPREGPVRELALAMLELAEVQVEPRYIY